MIASEGRRVYLRPVLRYVAFPGVGVGASNAMPTTLYCHGPRSSGFSFFIHSPMEDGNHLVKIRVRPLRLSDGNEAGDGHGFVLLCLGNASILRPPSRRLQDLHDVLHTYETPSTRVHPVLVELVEAVLELRHVAEREGFLTRLKIGFESLND